jgi:hypothetical protein
MAQTPEKHFSARRSQPENIVYFVHKKVTKFRGKVLKKAYVLGAEFLCFLFLYHSSDRANIATTNAGMINVKSLSARDSTANRQ